MLIGIIGGLLGGLLGVGGGTIYVPLLVLLYHISQPIAQGVSLAVMIPMALLGSYSYFRKGNVRSDLFLEIIMGSVAGAFLGATLANMIDTSLLSKIFSLVIGTIGLKMMIGK